MTLDCGVAELRGSREGNHCSKQGGVVDSVRVGILKNILVVNYVGMNVVLMVVLLMVMLKHNQDCSKTPMVFNLRIRQPCRPAWLNRT